MKITRLAATVGVGVALSVAAASCGGQSSPPGTSGSPSSTVAPTSSVAVSSSLTSKPAIGLETVEEIASAIAAAEQGIRNASLSTAARAEWGRKQQRAYRALSGHSGWDSAVRALVPTGLQPAFDYNVAARLAVYAEAAKHPVNPPLPTLPAWTIVEPRPIAELMSYYREAQAATGVPWAYLAAINMVETRFGRIAGTSWVGAEGPMQFLPSTWKLCCTGNVLDPHDAILGAAAYLVMRGAPQNIDKALYGYNPNRGYVDAVEAYARNMLDDASALAGYHAWEVYVDSSVGTIRLPTGFGAQEPIDAASYLAAHPEDLAPVNN